MGNPRTRRKQLHRLAERRMAERRRRRQRRVALVLVLGILGLFGVGSAAALFLGREPDATPSPTSPPVEPVACGGERPAAAGQPKPTFDKAPEMQIDRKKSYRAVLETSCGTIEVELFADEAPVTVNSFVFLARQQFFDGLTFHRVVPGFVIQGGDPKGDGTGGPGYQFKNETVKSLRFDKPGVVAMANAGPDTNGSQFFITVAPARELNDGYTIFARVTEGMEVVQEINGLATDPRERPNETAFIERVRIVEEQ